MDRVSDAPLVVALGEARAKLEAGGDPAEYWAAVDAKQMAHGPRRLLELAKVELEERLARGMAPAEGPAVMRQFVTLLHRYEAVCDALDPLMARLRYRDKVTA